LSNKQTSHSILSFVSEKHTPSDHKLAEVCDLNCSLFMITFQQSTFYFKPIWLQEKKDQVITSGSGILKVFICRISIANRSIPVDQFHKLRMQLLIPQNFNPP